MLTANVIGAEIRAFVDISFAMFYCSIKVVDNPRPSARSTAKPLLYVHMSIMINPSMRLKCFLFKVAKEADYCHCCSAAIKDQE